ncbi:MAG: hypothetical protein R3B45_13030 [Bdellovibrionota bacterium]
MNTGLGTTNTASKLRITYGSKGSPTFYIGWRQDLSTDVFFQRISSVTPGTPTPPTPSAKTAALAVMDSFSNQIGLDTFDIAAGENSAGDKCILGVLYTTIASKTCQFEAYDCDGSSLSKIAGGPEAVTSITDCRFPQLFFNSTSKKFMAVMTDNANNKVVFAEFKYNSTSASLANFSSKDLRVMPNP